MASPAAYEDFNFLVNWGGTNKNMMRVGPLMRSNDVLEYRDGGDGTNVRQKVPGITRYEPIVMERRIQPGDTQFAEWADQVKVVGGSYTDALRDIEIVLLDGAMNPVITILVKGCWPSGYEISGLDGEGSALVVERLTLEYTSWSRSDT